MDYTRINRVLPKSVSSVETEWLQGCQDKVTYRRVALNLT